MKLNTAYEHYLASKKKKKMPHEIMAGDFGEEGENSDRKYNFRCIKGTKKELNWKFGRLSEQQF